LRAAIEDSKAERKEAKLMKTSAVGWSLVAAGMLSFSRFIGFEGRGGGLRRGRKKEGEEAGRRDRRRRLWRSLLSFFSSFSLSSPAHDGDRHLLLAEERLVEAPVGSSGLDDDGDRGGLAA